MNQKFKKVMAVLMVVVAFFLFPLSVFSAGAMEQEGATGANVITNATATQDGPPAKYVFLFIGDGMAMSQITAAEEYSNALETDAVGIKKMGFSQFPVAGLTTTYDAGTLITDSASAATAIATGNKTLSGVLNMDVTKTKKFKTISEYAKEKGMKVGVVTTVSIDHATPAAFYAKVPARGNMYDIAVQLTQSGLDYFGGGGFVQPKGKNNDQPDVIEMAKKAGYTYVNTKEAFRNLKPGVGKVLAVNSVLQDSSAMPYEIDRSPNDLSLADYTEKGIELLSDDPDGFFMMVEGGKIDWACHANDAATAILDTLAFDKAITKATEFAMEHPNDTLIVVTGDHETGGMTIGFAGTKYSTFFNNIASQKMSFTAFDLNVLDPYKKARQASGKIGNIENIAPAIKDAFGLDYYALTPLQQEQLSRAYQRTMGNEIERSAQEDQYLLYGGYEPLIVKITQLLNQSAGIAWTSYSHTGVPVATFAKGARQDLFGGYYDNTDLFRKLTQAMNITVAKN